MPLRVEMTDRDGDFFFSRQTLVAQDVKSTRRQNTAPTASMLRRIFDSPLTAVSLVAVAVVALLAVLILNPRFRFGSGTSASVRKENPIVEEPVQVSAAEPVAVEPEIPDAPVVTPVESQPEPQSEMPASIPKEPEPAASVAATEPAPEPAQVPAPAPDPPVASKPKKTVAEKLAQKFLQYRQPKISRREFLKSLEEQINTPIRYNADELGADRLDEKVMFQLENKSLGDVVNLVVDAAGWQVVINEAEIRLTKKE